jgi:alpha-N-arabinofuranosidase
MTKHRAGTVVVALLGALAVGSLLGASSLAAEPTAAIAIDASQRGEPVSKYIYGQFIEHLGRCIYGGIWAEMLEDRKFYFPVTPEYAPYKKLEDTPFPVVGASPWEILGAGVSVTMVAENPFVGEHTPRLSAGSGIRQHDLGLVAGKKYVGYVWIKPAQKKCRVTVALAWGEQPAESGAASIEVASDDYQKQPFAFTAGKTTDRGRLTIQAGRGDCLVGTVSLMPADNVHGMRPDTLALLKELDSPVYRWPGGNFVSGYDWRDGIGDRDRRPPRKNPAWTGVEHNDFGIDDFMLFCKLLGTEPLVVVNTGLGQVDMALEELRYANGGPDTPQGRLRAKNGHPEPYQVTWWGIGNEMYGKWQLGHMATEEYVKKHNEFADAMRATDPSIKLIAVGAVGPWSEAMMRHSADHMDLISEHFYRRDKPDLAEHVRQLPDAVREKADAHRRYRAEIDSLRGKDVRIALDEWNYWYGPHLYGELGTRYFLKDALGIAAGLNEMVRQSDMFFMANYAQTVNVIGSIKTSKTDASLATTGLALALYRRHFGAVPVAVQAPAPLDVAAALTEDGKAITIAVVNPTMEKREVPFEISGVKLTGSGRLWQIAGSDAMAYNAPGEEAQVEIEETAVEGVADSLSVAPCSISLYRLGVK